MSDNVRNFVTDKGEKILGGNWVIRTLDFGALTTTPVTLSLLLDTKTIIYAISGSGYLTTAAENSPSLMQQFLVNMSRPDGTVIIQGNPSLAALIGGNSQRPYYLPFPLYMDSSDRIQVTCQTGTGTIQSASIVFHTIAQCRFV